MELLVSVVIGALTACGVYLCLRRQTFELVLGLSLLGYGVNVFVFASGGLTLDSAPLIAEGIAQHPDPLPQALVLTAIVIGFAMIALFIVLALRAFGDLGSDAIDPKDET